MFRDFFVMLRDSLIWLLLACCFLIVNSVWLFFIDFFSLTQVFLIIFGLVLFTYTLFIISGKVVIYLGDKEKVSAKKVLKKFHETTNKIPFNIDEVEISYNKILNIFDVHLDNGQIEVLQNNTLLNYFSYLDIKNQTPFRIVLTKLIQSFEKEYSMYYEINPIWKEHYKDTKFLFDKGNYQIICNFLERETIPELKEDLDIFIKSIDFLQNEKVKLQEQKNKQNKEELNLIKKLILDGEEKKIGKERIIKKVKHDIAQDIELKRIRGLWRIKFKEEIIDFNPVQNQ